MKRKGMKNRFHATISLVEEKIGNRKQRRTKKENGSGIEYANSSDQTKIYIQAKL